MALSRLHRGAAWLAIAGAAGAGIACRDAGGSAIERTSVERIDAAVAASIPERCPLVGDAAVQSAVGKLIPDAEVSAGVPFPVLTQPLALSDAEVGCVWDAGDGSHDVNLVVIAGSSEEMDDAERSLIEVLDLGAEGTTFVGDEVAVRRESDEVIVVLTIEDSVSQQRILSGTQVRSVLEDLLPVLRRSIN